MYLLLKCETTCITDKYNWHLRQKKPWFIKLYSVPSLKKTPILKKSLPLAQEGQKRSCTSQGHCVENQSHCWRIQTSQVWQLKTTTYNYAIHTNILIHVNPKLWYASLDKQLIKETSMCKCIIFMYLLNLLICKSVNWFFFLPTNEHILDSIFKVNKQSNGHYSEIWMVARCERHLLGYSSCINCSNSHRMFSRSLISSPEGAKSSTI